MNLLFVLPSLCYGLYLFVTSGSPTLLVMSAMTFCVWLLVARQRDVDLKAEVSQKDGRVYVGDRRLGWFPWLWGKQVRNLVYESYRSTNEVQIPWVEATPPQLICKQSSELFLVEPSRRNPHLLIIGRSGSGKTELLKWFLQARENFLLIDFKGGFDYPDLDAARLVTQQDEPKVIELLSSEIDKREAGAGLPELWVVVDELGEVLKSGRLTSVLETIAAKGRGLGIQLVLVNQTMTAIPRTIWANCSHRIVLFADPIDRVQLGFAATSKISQIDGQISGEYLGESNREFYFPLARASSKPLQAVVEESSPFGQILQVRRSKAEPTEPQNHHDHLLARRVQPYTWPD